jgi:ATP-dependent Clp protease ATP-binding subunit ClpC
MDAANMLKPALVRGDVRVIGATTGEEYERWIRRDPALERRFQPVTVTELDEAQTWEVLVARRPRLERHHAVAVSDDALRAAIVLTDRFVPERARPDKAIDVLDEACAHAQATARVSPELERLIRERRRVDAALRRGQGADTEDAQPLDIPAALERLGREIEALISGAPADEPGEVKTESAVRSAAERSGRPEDRRAELDRLLRIELETQGIVVDGRDVARVVAAATGKGIEWSG